MKLRTRLVLVVGISVSTAIIAVASVLTILAWRSMLDQAETEGAVIARLLAQSATVSEQVVTEVGDLLDREMAAHALLASHLADIADKAGLSDKDLSRRLMEITAKSSISELWISDAKGRLRAGATDDFAGTDKVVDVAGLPQPALEKLLSGQAFSLPLGVGREPLGGVATRYVGVRGVDSPRAVLVGREQDYMTRLQRTLGVQRLLDTLLHNRLAEALWVFGADGKTIARSLSPELKATDPDLSAREIGLVQAVLGGAPSKSVVSSRWISVAAAMPDAYGIPAGVVLARLSSALLRVLLTNYLLIGGLIAVAALLIGILLSVVTGRRVAAPMMRIAGAAEAVDAKSFVPGSLSAVAARRDELGHLARTFEAMAEQVMAREEKLEQQVRERTIELLQKNEALDLAKRRLEADLELAKVLQSTILPHEFPADGEWRGIAEMTPALQMAGDFYDYVPLDEHRLGLVIADVSGKGVAPAFFMAVSRGALQEAALHHDEPGACLAAANDRLCAQNPLDMFVTVFYAVIDKRNGAVSYSNGGHNPPVLVGTDGATRMLPLTGDMALGVMPGLSYSSAALTLQPGETLFLYTDGVSEAMNPAGEEFGEKRLRGVLTEAAQQSVGEMLTAATDAVKLFAGSAPQSDDITCLVVRFLGDRIEYAP